VVDYYGREFSGESLKNFKNENEMDLGFYRNHYPGELPDLIPTASYKRALSTH